MSVITRQLRELAAAYHAEARYTLNSDRTIPFKQVAWLKQCALELSLAATEIEESKDPLEFHKQIRADALFDRGLDRLLTYQQTHNLALNGAHS